jgi:hypothetical protein
MSDGTTHWHNCYAFGREHYDCLLAEASRRGDEVKRLREQLRQCAVHDIDCAAIKTTPKECDCGLDAALAAGEVKHD